jgi:hypothetical protein
VHNSVSFGPPQDESVVADIAPCSDVVLFRNDEVLLAVYDYGRFQALYLTEDEFHELAMLLEKSNVPKNILAKQGNPGVGAAKKNAWFFAGRVRKD